MPALSRALARLRASSISTLGVSASVALLAVTTAPATAGSTAAAAARPKSTVPGFHPDTAWLRADTATRAAVPYAVVTQHARALGPYAQSQQLRLVLALRPHDLAGQERFLNELQDKRSPN